MPNLNKFMGMGNLTREADVKFLPSGSAVAEFGIAINRKWKSADGQAKEEVFFGDCSIFGKRAEVVGKYFKKCDPIFIEGYLKLESWESKDGTKRSKVKIIVENFEFIGGNKQQGEQSSGRPQANAPQGGYEPAITEDSVPF